jgi:hypothetical protein
VRDALGNRPVDRRGATGDPSLGAARRACIVTEVQSRPHRSDTSTQTALDGGYTGNARK